jgi:uncharacterized PurR-regulated membrane protein YhhQ (DUF165 family)
MKFCIWILFQWFFTEIFKERDPDNADKACFTLEEWVEITLFSYINKFAFIYILLFIVAFIKLLFIQLWIPLS